MHLDSQVSPPRHKSVDCMWGGWWVYVVWSWDPCPSLYKQEWMESLHCISSPIASIVPRRAQVSWAPWTFAQPLLLATMEQGKKEKQQQRGKLQRVLREQKARLYIIRRCVVMLLCWSDWYQMLKAPSVLFSPIFFTLPLFGGWITGSHDMKALCFLASCGRQGYLHIVL